MITATISANFSQQNKIKMHTSNSNKKKKKKKRRRGKYNNTKHQSTPSPDKVILAGERREERVEVEVADRLWCSSSSSE